MKINNFFPNLTGQYVRGLFVEIHVDYKEEESWIHYDWLIDTKKGMMLSLYFVESNE